MKKAIINIDLDPRDVKSGKKKDKTPLAEKLKAQYALIHEKLAGEKERIRGEIRQNRERVIRERDEQAKKFPRSARKRPL